MKKLMLCISLLYVACTATVTAQINVGSTAAPDPSAMLQVSSSTGGFRPPQVSLASTSIFGLTAPSTAAAAYGMIVYNTNAAITGTANYPQHGVGDYWWDSLGWVSFAFRNPAEFESYGTVGTNETDAVNTGPLDMGTLDRFVSTGYAVIKGGGDSLEILTAGTYKIDVDCRATNVLSTSNTANDAIFTSYLYNGSTLLASGSATQTKVSGSLSNDYLYMHMYYSFIGSIAAGSKLYVTAISNGMPSGVTSTFEVVGLQVQHIQ